MARRISQPTAIPPAPQRCVAVMRSGASLPAPATSSGRTHSLAAAFRPPARMCTMVTYARNNRKWNEAEDLYEDLEVLSPLPSTPRTSFKRRGKGKKVRKAQDDLAAMMMEDAMYDDFSNDVKPFRRTKSKKGRRSKGQRIRQDVIDDDYDIVEDPMDAMDYDLADMAKYR